MLSKQLWINEEDLEIKKPKVMHPSSLPMNHDYGILVNKNGLSPLSNWVNRYIKANNLDFEKFIKGPVLKFLTTITAKDFLNENETEESLMSLRVKLEHLFPKQALPHVKGYALEDVNFPHIVAEGLARIQDIELLISGEYEGTHIQKVYNSHKFQNKDWTIQWWHLGGIDTLFVDCLLNELFIILHAGENPVVNIPRKSSCKYSKASTSKFKVTLLSESS